MIEQDAILKLIQQNGYATEKYIRGQYTEDQQELLDVALTYLMEKNTIRKIQYQAPSGEEALFYVL